MFTEVFVETGRRQPWPMAVSSLLQCLLIGLLLLLPLLTTRAVPPIVRFLVLSPPPGSGRTADQPPKQEPVQRSTQTAPSQFRNGQLVDPVAIPSRIPIIVDNGPADSGPSGPPGAGNGVPWGIGNPNLPSIVALLGPRAAPAPPPSRPPAPEPRQTVSVSKGVQEAKLISRPLPVYPPIARSARISGVVRLMAFISENGVIEELRVVEGHPLLVQAAVEAVRQWRYQPTILNGMPVRVETTIDVFFTLSQ